MPAPRLIDRQVALLRHLTDADVIFGQAAKRPSDASLDGIDAGHLRLEAWFSFTKRIAKIEAVLPRTFKALGERLDPLLRAFAAACPPQTIGRLANGRQFLEFMADRWPDEPPYLADLAHIEFAFAQARASRNDRTEDDATAGADGPLVRRPGTVILIRCGFDVRPLFEGSDDRVLPARRDTPLLVHRREEEAEPRIFELPGWLFDELAALDDWMPWVDLAIAARRDADTILRDLIARGFLETRP